MSAINKYYKDVKFRDYFSKYEHAYKKVLSTVKAYEINEKLKSSNHIYRSSWSIINKACKESKSCSNFFKFQWKGNFPTFYSN